jgi:hypothetical protein
VDTAKNSILLTILKGAAVALVGAAAAKHMGVCVAFSGCNNSNNSTNISPVQPSLSPLSPSSSPITPPKTSTQMPKASGTSSVIPTAQPKVVSFCPNGEKLFVSAETSLFLVSICGRSSPASYVGIAKQGGASIRLPLSEVSNERFLAKNGDYTYVVTRNSLAVFQKGKVTHEGAISSYQFH